MREPASAVPAKGVDLVPVFSRVRENRKAMHDRRLLQILKCHYKPPGLGGKLFKISLDMSNTAALHQMWQRFGEFPIL